VRPTIVLAGRWSGRYYGYGRQGSRTDCADTGCTLTYDIVACRDGWCGIAVKDDKTCGSVGVRLSADAAKEGSDAFKGKLELAKGSAPYTVEAWYRAEEGASNLHFLGDTGPELLLMRRSFPFEADLARTGDATCTLDKATSEAIIVIPDDRRRSQRSIRDPGPNSVVVTSGARLVASLWPG
jgi:hypothetical protein